MAGKSWTEPVNWDRDEDEPCEHGTIGCCVDHTGDPDYLTCYGWDSYGAAV